MSRVREHRLRRGFRLPSERIAFPATGAATLPAGWLASRLFHREEWFLCRITQICRLLWTARLRTLDVPIRITPSPTSPRRVQRSLSSETVDQNGGTACVSIGQ